MSLNKTLSKENPFPVDYLDTYKHAYCMTGDGFFLELSRSLKHDFEYLEHNDGRNLTYSNCYRDDPEYKYSKKRWRPSIHIFFWQFNKGWLC